MKTIKIIMIIVLTIIITCLGGIFTYRIYDHTNNNEEKEIIAKVDNKEIYASDSIEFPTAMLFLSSGTDNSEIELIVTTTPEYVLNKNMVWNVSWSNNKSEWATGKNVNDYFTVTPEENATYKAKVKCNAAFAEKININVSSEANPDATAQCVVDYAKRLKGINIQFESSSNDNTILLDCNQDGVNSISLLDMLDSSYKNDWVTNGNIRVLYQYESIGTISEEVTSEITHYVEMQEDLYTAYIAKDSTIVTLVNTPGLSSGYYSINSYDDMIVSGLIAGMISSNTDNVRTLLFNKFVETLSEYNGEYDFMLRVKCNTSLERELITEYHVKFDRLSEGFVPTNIELNENVMVV